MWTKQLYESAYCKVGYTWLCKIEVYMDTGQILGKLEKKNHCDKKSLSFSTLYLFACSVESHICNEVVYFPSSFTLINVPLSKTTSISLTATEADRKIL